MPAPRPNAAVTPPATYSTEDRRRDSEDLTAALLSLAAARDFDQPVELTPRQATLIIRYLTQHKIVPYGF